MNNKNFDEIINNIKTMKSGSEAQDYIMNSLTPNQSKKLQDVLSDQSALERLLSTPQAKNLLKRFTEEDK